MKNGSIHTMMIQDEIAFTARLREANRIKHNKSIIDPDAYFHRVFGYLPDDLPSFVGGVRT